MKFVPDQIGAEPKKIAILVGLLAAFGFVYYLERTPDSAAPLTVTSPGAAAPVAIPAPAPVSGVASRNEPPLPMPPSATTRPGARRGEAAVQDFHPTLKIPEGTDVSSINPELKLAALVKVRDVAVEGGRRSLFEFGNAPAPVIPKVAPVKPVAAPPTAPVAAPAPAPTAIAAKPVSPPIPLKFYGFVNDSSRRGFFIDGEEIVVAGENDTIRNRYHILRINATSAVIEDTVTKSQQTLVLVEEVQG